MSEDHGVAAVEARELLLEVEISLGDGQTLNKRLVTMNSTR
jgi:hypothetical protein